MKKQILAGIILLCSAVVFAGNKKLEPNSNRPSAESEEESELESLIILENESIHTLHPHLTSKSDDSQILTGLYEGLFTYNPVTLEPVPGVASEYKTSRDKKRWTFTINPKAKFSNGEKITAADVRYSWLKLLATPDAPYSSLLDIIEGAAEYRNGTGKEEDVGIYELSKNKLVVHLQKPANYLPNLLCHPAFSVISKKENVFSGPFVISEHSGKILILRKNNNYWDKKNVELEQITYIQSDDFDENAYWFNTGKVDWVSGSVNYNKIINKNSIVFNAQFGTSFMFFKTGDKNKNESKIWDNIKFRQAVFEAMPWESFRKNYTCPTETFVYPLQGYPVIEGFSYTDTEEAKRLIKEAKKECGMKEDDKVVLEISIPDKAYGDDDISILKKGIESVGIEVVITKVPWAKYYSSLPESKANVFSYSWIGDFADPLTFLDLFRSDSSLNDSGWKNAEYDALLDKAGIVTAAERYGVLGQAESLLLDNYIVIPIHNPVCFNVIDINAVKGWSPNSIDIHPLKYLKKVKVSSKVPNII